MMSDENEIPVSAALASLAHAQNRPRQQPSQDDVAQAAQAWELTPTEAFLGGQGSRPGAGAGRNPRESRMAGGRRERNDNDRIQLSGQPNGIQLGEEVDKQEFIDLLNEDLGTEYQSIVQYVQHGATIKGAEYRSIVEELAAHLAQELDHAKTLAEQIDFLGGRPTVIVPSVPDVAEGTAALRADLDLEQRQLERYRQRVADAADIGLPDVAEALRPLLEQTQDHVRELQDALGT